MPSPMLIEDPIEAKDVPKLIQPRSHRAKVCVWADLTVDDVDRINESDNAAHIKQVLAEVFQLSDHRDNLKAGIILDLYYYTIQFAKENGFNKEKLSTLFSIVKKTHEVCIETPFGNVDQTFNYFKELVLCHSVNRPPFSIELFTADEIRSITEYVINTYFRHFKMYKYAFTPLVRLDLSLTYAGMPPSPPQSEVGDPDVPIEESAEDLVPEDTERGTGEGEQEEKTPEPEESDARKELRSMIQTFLSEEVKKMKVSVEEQIKTTEETLNKKLDTAEGGAKGGKGGRGSAKGKKK
ncbi:coiled-coil domain-containing protein 189-like [Mizuhopecten yessoensis]|uniref:Coiled-coil domain-containing protein C16orf93-like n=1 Tax=Mizuhopecten yessoensis TaxID=6573 RepID=A0A210Q7V5_MIZYE|nr:coiled-coil domain-containing protein 189-like [Mizuhopecten yessoensis]OWF44814.1 Coiled-coil domain-containing protein C16orf93-like [Mizuhopecten yessoensis]